MPDSEHEEQEWSPWSRRRVREEERDEPGVYEIGNRGTGKTFYFGSGPVRSSLIEHFPDGSEPVPPASGYRVTYVDDEEEARERQRALLQEFHEQWGDLPRFNEEIPPAS